APELPGRSASGQGLCVLVVEDNEAVGSFATELLADLGYNTRWVGNAAAALALLEQNHLTFDVVFSDIVMPGMGGIEMAQVVRNRYPGLPVVLTSGYSNVLAQEGRHGFELLQKPYSVETLSRIIQKAVAAPRTL
ncbi:response regulator, partial [Caulobacter sp. S45]|uniref:response regulator n=1 Tax=Caulobacter sp. S45 TaxID=1641861 RepID=UPI00157652EC